MKHKKICIVGAGIFGTTLSLILSENKRIKIDLYERNKDILNETSLKNQHSKQLFLLRNSLILRLLDVLNQIFYYF